MNPHCKSVAIASCILALALLVFSTLTPTQAWDARCEPYNACYKTCGDQQPTGTPWDELDATCSATCIRHIIGRGNQVMDYCKDWAKQAFQSGNL